MKNKEIEVEYITLENNNKYILLASNTINENEYYFLINANNKNDFVIRKKINNELVGLDNEEEFELVIKKMRFF